LKTGVADFGVGDLKSIGSIAGLRNSPQCCNNRFHSLLRRG
jgi:hypothetical protein